MHSPEGENVAGDRQQFDAGGKPDANRAPQRNPQIGSQRMAGRPLASELREDSILFQGEGEFIIVSVENGGDAIALFWGIEGHVWNVAKRNLFAIQFPGNEIAIAHPIEPGALPVHKALGNELAGGVDVLRGKGLKFVKGHCVADGPGNEGQGGCEGHQGARQEEAAEFSPAQENDSQDKEGDCQE
jgi:hypothetical protein